MKDTNLIIKKGDSVSTSDNTENKPQQANFSKKMKDDNFVDETPEVEQSVNLTGLIRGFNQTKEKMITAHSPTSMGYVFMTRPTLNLTDINLMATNKLSMMLSASEHSILHAVRCTLDPYLNLHSRTANVNKIELTVDKIDSPLVNAKSPWIPAVTNYAKNLSGWGDETIDYFASQPGVQKEQIVIPDGIKDLNGADNFDLTLSNNDGGFLDALFVLWIEYINSKIKGSAHSHDIFSVHNVMDYTTRIYRMTLDPLGKYVRDISFTGYAVPISYPMSSRFNMNSAETYVDLNEDSNLRLAVVGQRFNEPYIIRAFNKHATLTCKDYDLMEMGRAHNLIKIPHEELGEFHGQGYPKINVETKELEWWIENTIYFKIKEQTWKQ